MQSYVYKSPSICFQETKINMKLTVKMFACIAGAFTMTWVWFLNLEMVKDVEGN